MSSRPSFQKLQRERRKKAKAAAKRARRQGRTDETQESPDDATTTVESSDDGDVITPDELLARVENLQSRLERGAISLDEFEEEKAELAERLASMP